MVDATSSRVRMRVLTGLGRRRLSAAAWPPLPARRLRAVAPEPMALPSPPARRRAPARSGHAPELANPWHQPSARYRQRHARAAGDGGVAAPAERPGLGLP